jgi:hypothetical protein
VLRRFRLYFTRRGDIGNERQVNEDRILPSDFLAELSNGFEERQGFDVADRAANLDDDHVVSRRDAFHVRLDLVGHVRNHLHGAAEVFAAPFLVDDVLVDATRRHVVRL